MLVSCYEIINGVSRRIAEGDVPEEKLAQSRVGDIIPLARVTAHSQRISFSTPEVGNRNPIPIEQYRIIERFDRVTATGMTFIELAIEQRFP